MKISLLVLRCKDLDKSKAFYEQFGLTFAREQHGSGAIHYSTDLSGTVLELYPSSDLAFHDNTRLGFELDNVQELIGGVLVLNMYDGLNGKVYVISDPDGRKIELSAKRAQLPMTPVD